MGWDEFGPAYPEPKDYRLPRPLRARIADLAVMVVFIALLFWLLGCTPSHGQEYYEPAPMPHHAHPEDLQMHERFYFTWMEPDHPQVSCCSLEDCYPTEARAGVATQWAAKRREDGKWMDVPDEKVERVRQAPDGRAHVCMPKPGVFKWDVIYCFAPPASM